MNDRIIDYIDAHFHAIEYARNDPPGISDWKTMAVWGLASCHSLKELEKSRSLMAGHGPCLFSFGIHPQSLQEELKAPLAELAENGQIAAIGECGFDFFGDRPERIRNPGNEKNQKEYFEFQLERGIARGLPLVLHMRKATDLLFFYSKSFKKLPAVILHSWTGPVNEALAFLSKVPAAKFSFGTSILNGNLKARASARALPLSAILSETDAPYQPPRAAPIPHAPLIAEYSAFRHLPLVVAELARLRGAAPESIRLGIIQNFKDIFSYGV